MWKKYLGFLLSELLVVAAVVTTFSIVEQKVVGGLVGGTLFVAQGFWILIAGIRTKSIRRSFTFYLVIVHLGLCALPLMLTRLWNLRVSFDLIEVFGLPGPVFHRISTTVYLCLILGTLFDLVWSVKTSRNLLSGRSGQQHKIRKDI